MVRSVSDWKDFAKEFELQAENTGESLKGLNDKIWFHFGSLVGVGGNGGESVAVRSDPLGSYCRNPDEMTAAYWGWEMEG